MLQLIKSIQLGQIVCHSDTALWQLYHGAIYSTTPKTISCKNPGRVFVCMCRKQILFVYVEQGVEAFALAIC